MTREEIMQLNTDYLNGCESEHKMNELFSYALEQQPCDDAISRILTRMWNCRGKHTTSIDKVKMEQIIRDELPSVTRQTGEWIDDGWYADGHSHKVFHCSECGHNVLGFKEDLSKFCLNCGAKMVEPQESEEV